MSRISTTEATPERVQICLKLPARLCNAFRASAKAEGRTYEAMLEAILSNDGKVQRALSLIDDLPSPR